MIPDSQSLASSPEDARARRTLVLGGTALFLGGSTVLAAIALIRQTLPAGLPF